MGQAYTFDGALLGRLRELEVVSLLGDHQQKLIGLNLPKKYVERLANKGCYELLTAEK